MLRLVRPSILLMSARDRIATAAETVTASRLWSAMSVNSLNKTIKRFENLIGSLGHHQNLTHCWHYGTRHNMQSFIIIHSSCAEQYGDISSDTDSLIHTQLNHQRLVSDKSAIACSIKYMMIFFPHCFLLYFLYRPCIIYLIAYVYQLSFLVPKV